MHDCSSSAARREGCTLDRAVDIVRNGGVVVYPTETLYGLGVDALNSSALRRLVELKGREAGKPISVLVDNEAMLQQLVVEISPTARDLMRRFWPGPLTLVLPARQLSDDLTGGSGTIGVRISSCAVATDLVRRLARPITSPSANPAGGKPPVTLAEARAYFGVRVDGYVDGGTLPGEPASTVVRVCNGEIEVVREGAITITELGAR